MKKPETLYNSLLYCLKIGVLPLIECYSFVIEKSAYFKNANNQLMKEVNWDAKNKSYKEKIWASGGVLAFERVLDANMKVINEKKLIKIEQEPLNP